MKRHLIVAILLASAYTISAQGLRDPNAVVLPSVNNKFFVSNTAYDVSLFTGTNSVNIPLYTVQSKNRSIPISLSYVASRGIKVQDYANYVGMGWQLNAAGQVTRIVRGLPDDKYNGYCGPNSSGVDIAAAAASGTTDKELMTAIGTGQKDGEPDIFSVKTPFFSFQFVLDEHGNAVFPNNSGFKIEQNIRLGGGWVITDDQGNQYLFGSSIESKESATTEIFEKPANFVSSWYLDRIVAYNNTDIITFNYTSGPDYSLTRYVTTRIVKEGYGVGDDGTEVKDISSTVTFNSPKYLTLIRATLGSVSFNYQFDRRDVAGGARLTDMSVTCYNYVAIQTIKRYQFGYSYFGDPSSNPEALRLKLDYVDLYGVASTITDPPIRFKTFTYESATNLPPRNSVEFDYWGYYNVNTSGTTLYPDANKNPDAARTRANILIGVLDASGEKLEFQYEQNKYYDATLGNVDVGGLRIAKVSKKLPTGEDINTQYVYDVADFQSSGQIYNPNYKTLSREVLHHLTFCNINGQWGLCGVTTATITISENLYHTYDLDGVFIGYSTVKVISQNGGYELYNFTNFSDFPDVFSTVSAYQIGSPSSLSYKRGLLKHKETHLAGGYKLSEVTNNYTSLDNPVTKKAYGITAIPTYANDGSWNIAWPNFNAYATNVENYLLSQTIQRTYDQYDQALFQENVTNFTYGPGKRLVSETATTDSKGNPRNKKFFYAGDANIPYVSAGEQVAINAMVASNRTNTLIHSVETNNATTYNTHNTYLNFIDPGGANKIFHVNTKSFVNNNIDNATVQQFQYDLSTAAMTAVNKLGGPFVSTLHGYNGLYTKAKVSNAVNINSLVYGPGGSGGGTMQFDDLTQSQSVSFVAATAGDVQIILNGTTSATGTCNMSYELMGPVHYTGSLCHSISNGCGGWGNSVTLTGLPAGNYTLYATAVSEADENGINGTITAYYSYPGFAPAVTSTNEFYYEGFEENSSWTSTTTPFAGRRCYLGDYTVPFTMPNSRAYQVDYHYLLNGQWYAASKPFQNNMILSEGTAIDEIRVYPTDAQMVSYTYEPWIGITSEGNARNRYTFYEYDNFGRLKIIRDNDKNIIKRYDYVYQSGLGQTCPRPVITDVTNNYPNISVSYIVPTNWTDVKYSVVQNSTGATIVSSSVGRVGPPIGFTVPAGNQSYTVTITSYSTDCPQGVSYTQVVTIP